MKKSSYVLAAMLGSMAIVAPLQAHARADASAQSLTVSMFPLALSVGTTAAAISVAPIAGSMFVVKGIEVSAKSSVYVIERVSDGVRWTIEVAGQGVKSASNVVGASVQVTVLGAGVLLSIASETLAFIPNELGKTLFHNESLSKKGM